MKQICPYCLESFKQIFRHKCTNAPDGFKFVYRLCTTDFFEHIYRELGILNEGKLDVNQIDLKLYQRTFFKYFYRLILMPDPSFELAADDSKFDDQFSQADQEEQELQSNQIAQNEIGLVSAQLCPHCFKNYRDLYRHKCKVKPEFSFPKIVGESSFFRQIYIESEIDPSQQPEEIPEESKNKYQAVFQQYFEAIQEVGAQFQFSASELKAEGNNSLRALQIPRICPNCFRIVPSLYRHHCITEDFEQSEPQVCPFCYQYSNNLFDHSCANIPEGFVFQDIMDKIKFDTLYRSAGAYSQVNFRNLNTLNHAIYQRNFFQEYYRILGETNPFEEERRRKIEAWQRKREQEQMERTRRIEELKNKKLMRICPGCFQEFPNLSEHNCAKLEAKLGKKFQFRAEIETRLDFETLYRSSGGAQGDFVNLKMVMPKIYADHFFEQYFCFMGMENPFLKPKKEKPAKQPTSPQDCQKTSELIKKPYPEVCPICYQQVKGLLIHLPTCLEHSLHSSNSISSSISSYSKYMNTDLPPIIETENFLKPIYKKTGGYSQGDYFTFHTLMLKAYQREFFRNLDLQHSLLMKIQS